jgi:hypothetical protein
LGVYNFQVRRGKLIQLKPKYSSNQWWKNKFFFASGQWEFALGERAQEPRVPREVNMLFERGHRAPTLTPSELARVNKVLKWTQRHELCTYYDVLASVPRLTEFVYEPTGHIAVKLWKEVIGIPANLGFLAANTWGLGGDLKGNPFKAVVDLIDHNKLQMKRDVSAQGMAEEMLTMQFLLSIPHFAVIHVTLSFLM